VITQLNSIKPEQIDGTEAKVVKVGEREMPGQMMLLIARSRSSISIAPRPTTSCATAACRSESLISWASRWANRQVPLAAEIA